jgi:hypothetical protein
LVATRGYVRPQAAHVLFDRGYWHVGVAALNAPARRACRVALSRVQTVASRWRQPMTVV